MADVTDPDSPADVLAYLARRRCGICGAGLGSITMADVSPSRHSPAWRCEPPPPTCWDLTCPGCAQQITIGVREGESGPLHPSRVSRRGPRRRINE